MKIKSLPKKQLRQRGQGAPPSARQWSRMQAMCLRFPSSATTSPLRRGWCNN